MNKKIFILVFLLFIISGCTEKTKKSLVEKGYEFSQEVDEFSLYTKNIDENTTSEVEIGDKIVSSSISSNINGFNINYVLTPQEDSEICTIKKGEEAQSTSPITCEDIYAYFEEYNLKAIEEINYLFEINKMKRSQSKGDSLEVSKIVSKKIEVSNISVDLITPDKISLFKLDDYGYSPNFVSVSFDVKNLIAKEGLDVSDILYDSSLCYQTEAGEICNEHEEFLDSDIDYSDTQVIKEGETMNVSFSTFTPFEENEVYLNINSNNSDIGEINFKSDLLKIK